MALSCGVARELFSILAKGLELLGRGHPMAVEVSLLLRKGKFEVPAIRPVVLLALAGGNLECIC